MKRQKAALTVVCLVVVNLLAGLIAGTGCGGPSGETVTPVEEAVYGGTLVLGIPADPIGLDDAVQPHYQTLTLNLTNEHVWQGGWAKGQAGGYGTGESSWFSGGSINRLEHKAGALAESVEWDEAQKDTITLHLRQGVYWHDKPPANGREVTADDVVFSLQRHYTLDTAYFKRSYPRAAARTEISASDDHTVVIKCHPEDFADVITMLDAMAIFPRDAVGQFGDMTSWRNSIGTGPFILAAYMPGSSITYVRNPDYWGENPVGRGQGDQLPYVDEVQMLVIPDESTADALFRTGKLDILSCNWERAQEFLAMPELGHVRYMEDFMQAAICMRTDKEDSPYADVRVRQALMLAIDNQKILDQYYGGEGTLLKWPVGDFAEYAGAYMPLEELPASVQELYGYDPEKAKQLLAAAGYPDGFKTSIVCWNVPGHIDPLSIVQNMWAEVGVELKIDPKDFATYSSLQARRAYDHMIYAWYSGVGTYFKAINYTGPGTFNMSYVDDPVLNQAREEMVAAYPDEARADEIHAELMPYLLEQVYAIALPAAYSYRFWWPWVRNYSGEMSVGYYSVYNFAKYVWIDQELKESMGY